MSQFVEPDATMEELGLLGKNYERLQRALAGYLAAKAAYASGKQIYNWIQGKRAYTVTVLGTDYIYPILHAWILDRLPDEKRRALMAESVSRSNTEVGNFHGSSGSRRNEVVLYYDGTRQHTVDVNGYPIVVRVGPQENIPSELKLFGIQREKITLFAKNRQGRDAVIQLLNELITSLDKDKVPEFYTVTRWGEWRSRTDLPMRPLNSVILRDGNLENLLEDFQRFLSGESFYSERSIPWHRGYLFYGPPGTGKTSAARAIATHLELDLYYLSLGDIKKDDDILNLINQVPERSILLLEDIDIFHVATSREENKDMPSLSSLLNALDGISTPHGLITIMTTNDVSVLDEALIRPGRVDHREHFDLANAEQAKRIFRWFYGLDPKRALLKRDQFMAPADILSIMYLHKDNPAQAEIEIRRG